MTPVNSSLVFGVAVTDSEALAERLAGIAGQLSASSNKEEIAKLLKDASDLCQELNTRWLEIARAHLRNPEPLAATIGRGGGKVTGNDMTRPQRSSYLENQGRHRNRYLCR